MLELDTSVGQQNWTKTRKLAKPSFSFKASVRGAANPFVNLSHKTLCTKSFRSQSVEGERKHRLETSIYLKSFGKEEVEFN